MTTRSPQQIAAELEQAIREEGVMLSNRLIDAAKRAMHALAAAETAPAVPPSWA